MTNKKCQCITVKIIQLTREMFTICYILRKYDLDFFHKAAIYKQLKQEVFLNAVKVEEPEWHSKSDTTSKHVHS